VKQVSRLITLSLLSATIFLQGCNSVKKTLGIERDAPDPFSVTPSLQPLDMPPDFYALPTPNPGSPRPQDVKAMGAKKEKVLGANQAQPASSPGQQALLDLAGAEEGQDKLARELDNESRIESAKGKPVLEQLGIKKAKHNVLNPYEESIELQKKGIPQNRPVVAE
jgi:hypothetical protein